MNKQYAGAMGYHKYLQERINHYFVWKYKKGEYQRTEIVGEIHGCLLQFAKQVPWSQFKQCQQSIREVEYQFNQLIRQCPQQMSSQNVGQMLQTMFQPLEKLRKDIRVYSQLRDKKQKQLELQGKRYKQWRNELKNIDISNTGVQKLIKEEINTWQVLNQIKEKDLQRIGIPLGDVIKILSIRKR